PIKGRSLFILTGFPSGCGRCYGSVEDGISRLYDKVKYRLQKSLSATPTIRFSHLIIHFILFLMHNKAFPHTVPERERAIAHEGDSLIRNTAADVQNILQLLVQM